MVFESRQHPVGRLLDRLRAAQGDADVRHSIEGRALGEQGPELLGALEQRPVGLARKATADRVEGNVEQDRGPEPADRPAGPFLGERAASGRHHDAGKRRRPLQELGLALPEGGLAGLLEDRADGPPRCALDLGVDVDEREAEALGHPPSDRRLAARHEPDEKDPPGRAAAARGIESGARVLFDAAVRVEGADHRGGVGARVPDGVEPVQRNPADGDQGLRLGGRHAAERVQAPGGADALGRALEDRTERDVVRRRRARRPARPPRDRASRRRSARPAAGSPAAASAGRSSSPRCTPVPRPARRATSTRSLTNTRAPHARAADAACVRRLQQNAVRQGFLAQLHAADSDGEQPPGQGAVVLDAARGAVGDGVDGRESHVDA